MAVRDEKFVHTSRLVAELVQAADGQDIETIAHILSPLLYDFALYTLQHTLVLPSGAIKLVLGNMPDVEVWPV